MLSRLILETQIFVEIFLWKASFSFLGTGRACLSVVPAWQESDRRRRIAAALKEVNLVVSVASCLVCTKNVGITLRWTSSRETLRPGSRWGWRRVTKDIAVFPGCVPRS